MSMNWPFKEERKNIPGRRNSGVKTVKKSKNLACWDSWKKTWLGNVCVCVCVSVVEKWPQMRLRR